MRRQVIVVLSPALFVVLAATSLVQAQARPVASEALQRALSSGNFDPVYNDLIADVGMRQSYTFDEAGLEKLGRKYVAREEYGVAKKILNLNFMAHGDSWQAANALADAYGASGDTITARAYYQQALGMNPDNEHARQVLAELEAEGDDTPMGLMGDWEFDPEAMQRSMEQMGVQVSPEQMQQMQEAMAQMQQMQETGQMPTAPTEPRRQASRENTVGEEEAARMRRADRCSELASRYEPFGGPAALARLTGHYGSAADTQRLKTWNIDFTCEGRALWAVPLWADVNPPQLSPDSATRFLDSLDGLWEFRTDDSGHAESVTYISRDGRTQELLRLGDPVTF
jgi:tetratricopeptide (TPR) repeat protein